MKIIEDAIKDSYEIHISKVELVEALALLSKKDMEARLYHQVKHGQWEGAYHDAYPDTCSVCGYTYLDKCDNASNYCPNCGAKMDKEEE